MGTATLCTHTASRRITPHHAAQAREWAACWREVQPLRLLRAMHPSAAALVRGDEHVMGQLHASLRRHHAVLEGAHRYFAVAAAHGPPTGDGAHAPGERGGGRPKGRPGGRSSPAAAHARSHDAREAAAPATGPPAMRAPATGMSAAMWEGFAHEVGLHALLPPRAEGEGGSAQGEEQSEAARRVHAQVRQTIGGCNPVPQRLQPCASGSCNPCDRNGKPPYTGAVLARYARTPRGEPLSIADRAVAPLSGGVHPGAAAPLHACSRALHPCSRASARLPPSCRAP